MNRVADRIMPVRQSLIKSNPTTPFFSVLILCWNSQPYLQRCLEAMQDQTFKDFEIILVDNGSPEPVSVNEYLGFSELALRFIHLDQNLGFAGGNNYAAKFARGEYIVLLNSDAFPLPDWLQVIHDTALTYPGTSFASRQIMADFPDRLDGEGDNYHVSGLVWRQSYGLRFEQVSPRRHEVFSACGAAAIYPRRAFEAVQGFDDQYFAYVEDVDLGFRLRLIGIPCLFLPDAVVYHVGSASMGKSSDFSVYYGQRNLVWTFLKDVPALLIWVLLPGHLLANLLQLFLSLWHRQGRITWRAKRDALADLGRILMQRSTIQKRRTASVWSLMRVMDWNPISPFAKLWRR